MTSPTAGLLTRLDALSWRLEHDASFDAAELEAVAADVEAVKSGDAAELRALRDRLAQVTRVLAGARDRLAVRLGEAGRGRRAVRAYHAGDRG